MLYSNFISRNYIADIFAYGEKSYSDKAQRYLGCFDASFLFVYFDKLWDDLIVLKKRYPGKVSAQEATAFVLGALPSFYSYLINIARFAIMDCADNKAFADIAKNGLFKVRVGNYMAKTETVYAVRQDKDADELVSWFDQHLINKYTFGDYSGLDFSGKSFLYTDFRFARFQNSMLSRAVFDGSSLTGANFRGANLDGCRLDYCAMYEADFAGAALKNASIRNVRAKAGLTNEDEWKFVGFLPLSFRYANLTNADFTDASLTGADFTGAILEGADFTGAILDNAVFSGYDLPLTEHQKSKIILASGTE